jgi:hypothetical protein
MLIIKIIYPTLATHTKMAIWYTNRLQVFNLERFQTN